MPDADLIREVEQFLYREARLLDERRFREWLDLFTDDLRYFMVNRSNRYPPASKAIAVLDPSAAPDREDERAILDESKETLAARVARLDTGMAWAEDPPSRTRHLIANIEVEPGAAAAPGASLAAGWCSTRTCCRPRTSACSSDLRGRRQEGLRRFQPARQRRFDRAHVRAAVERFAGKEHGAGRRPQHRLRRPRFRRRIGIGAA